MTYTTRTFLWERQTAVQVFAPLVVVMLLAQAALAGLWYKGPAGGRASWRAEPCCTGLRLHLLSPRLSWSNSKSNTKSC